MTGLGPILTSHIPNSHYVAHVGWSTTRYLESLDQILTESNNPDILIVELGGNDTVVSQVSYKRMVMNFIQIARTHGVRKIIWIGPALSWNSEVQYRHTTVSTTQQRVLGQLQIPWYNSFPVTTNHHLHDGVHFTPRGYGVWARNVLPFLTSNIGE